MVSLIAHQYINQENELRYLPRSLRITRLDIESMLYHEIRFLQAVLKTDDVESIVDFYLLKIEDGTLDVIKLFNKALRSLNQRCDFTVTEDYYREFIHTFVEDRQFNLIYYNWVQSNYEEFKKPSLDHIIPLVNGGTNEISNLQWLTLAENQMKGYFSPQDWNFIKSRISDYLV